MRVEVPDAAKPLVCPKCGRRFEKMQGLAQHLKLAHDLKTAAEREAVMSGSNGSRPDPEPDPDSPTAIVRATLRGIAEPLREQRASVEARLVVLDREARELRSVRTELNAVLAKIDPTPTPKKSPSQGGANPAVAASNAERAARQLADKAEDVEAWLRAHPDEIADGFTANLVAGKATGEVRKGLSTSSAIKVLDLLRDRNVVRADRVTRGGGMSYKLVEAEVPS